MSCFIAIDIGTTHCKCLVSDDRDNIIHQAKYKIDSLQPQEGWHEQDAEIIFQYVLALLKESIAATEKKQIGGICFSAAMHSLLAVDATGKPLCNAITWADTRSKLYARQFRNSDALLMLQKESCVPVHAMSPLCKISWLRNERAEIFNQAYKFISIKEYIFSRLFGKYFIDEAMACATGLYNLERHAWSHHILKLAGIHEDKLSVVVPSLHIETELLPQIRKVLDTEHKISFVAGSSDGCLANLGSGALSEDTAVITMGTSGAVRITIPAVQTFHHEKLFRYALTNQYHVIGGPTNNGGIVLQWFAENILQLPSSDKHSFEKLINHASMSAPGSEGLLFLPYLCGERAPVWDENATGKFENLKLSHTTAHLSRALLEGISFSLRQILELIETGMPPVQTIKASGILTQSPFWLQMLANIFGRPVQVFDDADASCLGAVYLAMFATGALSQLDHIIKENVGLKTFLPDENLHKLYMQQYRMFCSLYIADKNV